MPETEKGESQLRLKESKGELYHRRERGGRRIAFENENADGVVSESESESEETRKRNGCFNACKE
ncbi:uncharacterized protein DS421_12g373650 [Arachis hypogaea]|nr:uncharacterized protein DS421_12g373650 [Arachis hypogaea]